MGGVVPYLDGGTGLHGGWRLCIDGLGQLVTLFSAPNAFGTYDNAGSIMSIDETLMCSFQILKPSEKKAKYQYQGINRPKLRPKVNVSELHMLTDTLDELLKQTEETKFNKGLKEILRIKSSDSFKILFDEFSSTSDMEKDIALMIINQICQTEELKQEIQKQTHVRLESFESLEAVILYIDALLMSGAHEEAKTMLFVMGNTSAGKSSMIRTLKEYTKTKVSRAPYIL